MKHRIALAGAFASGKTTAADFIMDTCDHHSLLGFATPLYELASFHVMERFDQEGFLQKWIQDNLIGIGLCAVDLEDFYFRVLATFEKTPVVEGKNRTLLQRLGTEVGRAVDPELWVRLFRRNVSKTEMLVGGGIINDNLRFENEYDCCRDLGFTVVYLWVSPETQARRYRKMYGRPPTASELSHASERDLPFIQSRADFVLDNDEDTTGYLHSALRRISEGSFKDSGEASAGVSRYR